MLYGGQSGRLLLSSMSKRRSKPPVEPFRPRRQRVILLETVFKRPDENFPARAVVRVSYSRPPSSHIPSTALLDLELLASHRLPGGAPNERISGGGSLIQPDQPA